ncbi:MAG TPA: sialidase family protein, partial [Anaerolineae bacterium]
TRGVGARTDYLVNGKGDCLLFLTAAKRDQREGRPFCAHTADGGATWQLRSWIGSEPETGFVIMPASVRLPDGGIIVALRVQPDRTRASIQAYRSDDEGYTWLPLPDPVPSLAPSNPPAIVRLLDGRLCLTFGVRAAPYRICARFSPDDGLTWGDELTLRADGANGDLGYTRTVQRTDGTIVTVYYFNDSMTGVERYIAATLWRAP